MKTLESIFIKYSQLARKIKQLKGESCELGGCLVFRDTPNSIFTDSCIEEAYKLRVQSEYEEEAPSFNEVFNNLSEYSEYGDACDVCMKRRELKRQRVSAQISLGHTRSLITNMGKKFEKEQAA
jgi:hypothetical protein